MATENTYQRVEQLPPNYLAQFFAGGQQGVPGIMPLLNQELVNRLSTFGVEGANPYTYSGQRIAGFTPAEQEGFRMTAEGMGGYLPYYQRGEQLTEQGLSKATGAYNQQQNLINRAVAAGEKSTAEAQNLLRQSPGIARSAYDAGVGQIGQAGGQRGQGFKLASGAGANLGEAQGMIRGSQFDPTQAQGMISGSPANLSEAYGDIRSAQFDPREARSMLQGASGRLGESAMTGYGATGRFDPGGIESFYNPFEEQVVQQTMDDVRKGLAQGDIARRASEVGAGAFGGSRSRLQAGELADAAARGAASQIGAIRSGGYQDASRRAQAAFESQQARQAGQANLLAGLGAQQSNIGAQLGQLGLSTEAQKMQRGQALGGLGLASGQQRLAAGQALGGLNLAGQRGQLAQAGALGQMAGQRAGMGTQLAGMGQNLAGLYGSTAGGLGSLGGNLANIYGGAGTDMFRAGAGLGQMYGGAGQQMAGFGQGVSALQGQDINRMLGIGGMQRGMDQRGLDLAYQNFVGQYNQPLQTFSQIGGVGAGFAPYLGGTTVAQGSEGNDTNPLMQGLGTALTAYGAFNNRNV